MGDRERLSTALVEAVRYLGDLPAPPNEANTCDWVIRPLLVALGYANHEIHAQSTDVSNKFPDYTILPGTEHTWYLEAKSWSVGLDSQHVDQALNYAHSNGRRWVVLSNGQEWRLYDDRIPGKSGDRLVATARLKDTDAMLRFLGAIGRDSMMAKKVDAFASERRVRDYLAAAIADPKSAVIQAIVKVVRQNCGNGPVDAQAVVDILNGAQATGVLPEPPPSSLPGGASARLYCRNRGAQATGRFDGSGIVMDSGSKLCKTPAPSFVETHARLIQKYLESGQVVDRGDHYEVVKDITFGSPSAASDLAVAGASNGWVCWVDESGTTLDSLFPRSEKEKWRVGWSR